MQLLFSILYCKLEMGWFIEVRIVDLNKITTTIKARVVDHLSAWFALEDHSPKIWKPPDQGWLKINTDVAVQNNGSYTELSCRDNSSSL
ncbi:hypothetical protein CJ030_MR8G007404 [Morella rubra]|uniref:Uncharacterized protein n=1 Tax=Morella rubra TaxID=262757 RepID=A0A6A1UNI3_9ROSI|nr:hypothetical protein CJ030_MR8G007404 [Morella rubra]